MQAPQGGMTVRFLQRSPANSLDQVRIEVRVSGRLITRRPADGGAAVVQRNDKERCGTALEPRLP